MKASVILFLIKLILGHAEAGDDGDILSAIGGVTDKLHHSGCVVVWIFDQSLPPEMGDKLIPTLQQSGSRTLLILNLSSNPATWFESQVEQIATYLHSLYRISRCYTFVIWIQDLRVLYPDNMNIHPGWRSQDSLVFASHHIDKSYHRNWTKYRFWGEIPNILGIRRPKPHLLTSNRIQVFTILPYTRDGARFHLVDIWLVNELMFERNAPLVWDKFTTFNGGPLRYAILWKAPYYIFGDSANPFVDGIDWRLLQLVCKHLGFTFNRSAIISTTWSGNPYNGNWTGALRFLQAGQVDLAVGGLSSSGHRLLDFDFTATYYGDAYVFISPITTANPVVSEMFTRPLDPEVWQILMVTCVGVAVTLKYLAWVDRQFGKVRSTTTGSARHPKRYPDYHFTSFLHNLYFLYNTFCQKPFPHVPISGALKIPFVTTSLSITILGSIFAGCLFSELFDPRKETSIDTFDEILNSKLPICVMDYDGILNYGVSKAKRVSLKRMWENATFADYPMSIRCIEDVIRGDKIFIDAFSRLNFIGRQRHTGINGIKFHFGRERLLFQTNIGWATRKRWPFLPKVSHILTVAVESGLVEHWMSFFMRGRFGWDQESVNILRDLDPLLSSRLPPAIPDTTKDLDPTRNLSWDERFVRLGFTQFDTVYNMWVQGMILGGIVFLGEILMHGTWTAVSVSQQAYARLRHWFRTKRLHRQILEVEQGSDPFRLKPVSTEYFVWNDLRRVDEN